MNKPVPVRCLLCSYEWAPLGTNLYHQESGCPCCAPNGWRPDRPTVFYYFRLRHETGRKLYKIGITSKSLLERRYYPSDRERMALVRSAQYATGREARAFETFVKRKYRRYLYAGETGFTFKCSEVFVRDVLGWDQR